MEGGKDTREGGAAPSSARKYSWHVCHRRSKRHILPPPRADVSPYRRDKIVAGDMQSWRYAKLWTRQDKTTTRREQDSVEIFMRYNVATMYRAEDIAGALHSAHGVIGFQALIYEMMGRVNQKSPRKEGGGATRQENSRQHKTRPGKTRQGETRQDKIRQDKATHHKTRAAVVQDYPYFIQLPCSH